MSQLRAKDGALVNNWYIVALSNEVKESGRIARTLYDKHYVVFRDDQGQVGVMEDRCLHRGAKLSEGTCEGKHLRCPYHGWSYNTAGVVCDIPSEGPDSNKAAQRGWRLPVLPSREQDGCIWVWTGDAESKTEGPSWRFPYHGKKDWAQYFMITDFDDEVTRLVENFMDVPHTVFVHSKWFRKKKFLKVPIHVDVRQGRVKVTYDQPSDSIGFFRSLLNPQNKPMVHTDEFIFPNLTRVDYWFGDNGFIINSQCSPITEGKTRVYTWITFKLGLVTRILEPLMRFYTRQVIEQDVQIMQNVGSNFKRFGDMQTKSTAADELHLAIESLRQRGIVDPAHVFESQYERNRELWI